MDLIHIHRTLERIEDKFDKFSDETIARISKLEERSEGQSGYIKGLYMLVLTGISAILTGIVRYLMK